MIEIVSPEPVEAVIKKEKSQTDQKLFAITAYQVRHLKRFLDSEFSRHTGADRSDTTQKPFTQTRTVQSAIASQKPEMASPVIAV